MFYCLVCCVLWRSVKVVCVIVVVCENGLFLVSLLWWLLGECVECVVGVLGLLSELRGM